MEVFTMKKIQNQLEKIGLECRFDTAVFGRYYDGTDHEYNCDVLRFSFDFIENGYGRYNQIMNYLDRFGKRHNGFRVHLTANTYSGRISGYIITAENDEIADHAQNIANKFLNAFWYAIHEGKPQAAAVAAGREAIA
jgi:hypothetical protein